METAWHSDEVVDSVVVNSQPGKDLIRSHWRTIVATVVAGILIGATMSILIALQIQSIAYLPIFVFIEAGIGGLVGGASGVVGAWAAVRLETGTLSVLALSAGPLVFGVLGTFFAVTFDEDVRFITLGSVVAGTVIVFVLQVCLARFNR